MIQETGLVKVDTNTPPKTPDKAKDETDLFIEEFGDAWTLEMVRFAHDDGGRCIEVFVKEEQANALRTACAPKYMNFFTVIIGVEEGWGAN